MSLDQIADAPAPGRAELSENEASTATCSRCGSSSLHVVSTRSAFWEGERLVVVEDIPAIVCMDCQEQHLDDQTVVLIDLLRGGAFPPEKALRQLTVPVFSLKSAVKGGDGL